METRCTAQELERVMDQYGNDMLRLCCAYLSDRSLAEDAVQDAFVKIYKGWPTFETPEGEKSWIMKVTINVCKDQLRSAWKRKVTLVEDYPELAQPEAPETEQGLLYRAVQALKPRYKEVILLHYYQQMRVSEISQLLGTPQSTVSVRLSRARRELEKMLVLAPVEEM